MLRDDYEVIRALARETADIAALPIQQRRKGQWEALNALRPERPMFTIDQMPWHELNGDGELTLRCGDPFLRGLERDLRRRLYKWRHLQDDVLVEPFVSVPKAVSWSFGLAVEEETLALDAANDVISHQYEDQLSRWEDLNKINPKPQVVHDEAETARREALAREALDGILDVRMEGAGVMLNTWDSIVNWRGATPILTDMIDRPEILHALMERLITATLHVLDQLEARGLMTQPQSIIHCSGAWTTELPAPGYDPARPRAKDVWTCGMAQIFSTVSPATHDEFEIAYVKRVYERFGLVYYGCCEPLDRKVSVIRKLPHVRKISMSPWADVNRGAEAMGKDYVLSRKPNPSYLAAGWDEAVVEKELRDTLAACARTGTPVEFLLKDISTVGYKPQRLWDWAKLYRRVLGE